jgi:pre-mRNA-processing factor 19
MDASTDLLELKVASHVAPKPLDSMSFPGMLKFLQEQWDTQMLEIYSLKSSLENTRKELSHALY